MSTWDQKIFTEDVNEEFLDELLDVEAEDVIESIRDSILLVLRQPGASEDDRQNALASATIAAIWAGAPFSSGEIAESYPFIRELAGEGDEELNSAALELLESVEDDDDFGDLDQFIEALS